MSYNLDNYNPYDLLEVTKNDSDEHIAIAFRKKAKKYHPDKAKNNNRKTYENYFNLINEAYDFIKTQREFNKNLNLRNNYNHNHNNKNTVSIDFKSKEDVKKFNEKFNENNNNPFWGKGTNTERLTKLEDYEKEINTCINQFTNKKFSQDEFNKLFEYNKQNQNQNTPDIKDMSIFKTTDGFNGYNYNSDFNNCAQVHSYNGLMITGDVGHGAQFSTNYSDYKKIFDQAKNPNIIIEIPDTYSPQEFVPINKKQKESELKQDINIKNDKLSEEQAFKEKLYKHLEEKDLRDKQIILSYQGIYDEETRNLAMSGKLKSCLKLIDTPEYKMIEDDRRK